MRRTRSHHTDRQRRWRLPTGVYNPVVTTDGHRWRDYELAAEAEVSASHYGPPKIPVPAADALSLGHDRVGRRQGEDGRFERAGGFDAVGQIGGIGGYSGAGQTEGGGGFTGASALSGGVDALEGTSTFDGARSLDGPRSFAGAGRFGGVDGRDGGGRFESASGRTGVDWFDGPLRPRRLDEARPYGRPGGLAKPDPQTQEDLAQAVRGRFPDPRGTWIRLVNAGGPSEDPFRSPNAVDCALAMLSTWQGEPMVSAPTKPTYDPVGKPVLTGETGGVARAEQWLGHRFEFVGLGRRAYVVIAHRLIAGGHGAAAMLITRWPTGGSHAWNAVNWRGEILWIDAQRGQMTVEPPYEDVTGVFSVIIDHEGRRL